MGRPWGERWLGLDHLFAKCALAHLAAKALVAAAVYNSAVGPGAIVFFQFKQKRNLSAGIPLPVRTSRHQKAIIYLPNKQTLLQVHLIVFQSDFSTSSRSADHPEHQKQKPTFLHPRNQQARPLLRIIIFLCTVHVKVSCNFAKINVFFCYDRAGV